jgi:hypothetical protein
MNWVQLLSSLLCPVGALQEVQGMEGGKGKAGAVNYANVGYEVGPESIAPTKFPRSSTKDSQKIHLQRMCQDCDER